MPLQSTCLHCEALFPTEANRLASGRGKFCNRACKSAYARARTVDRFWIKVEKSADQDGCWLYTGGIFDVGYGAFWVAAAGRNVGAHVFSWELHHGPIPDGLCVCHRCDERYPVDDVTYRRCVRPDHLFLGTPADNMADMAAKGRNRIGERHPMARLTERQVAEIRARYSHPSSRASNKRLLAAEYGVTEHHILQIVSGRCW